MSTPLAILPVSALLLGVTGLVVGTGVLGVLLPLRGVAEGFSTYGVAVMGGAPKTPKPLIKKINNYLIFY